MNVETVNHHNIASRDVSLKKDTTIHHDSGMYFEKYSCSVISMMTEAYIMCNGIHHLRKWNLPADTSVLIWKLGMYESALMPISHGIAHVNCE